MSPRKGAVDPEPKGVTTELTEPTESKRDCLAVVAREPAVLAVARLLSVLRVLCGDPSAGKLRTSVA
jgi:hypothetical protein